MRKDAAGLYRGRHDLENTYYFITTVTHHREKLFRAADAAHCVLETLHWLADHGRMELIVAMVMPDHLHFIARPISTSLAQLLHSLKSYSANGVNSVIGRRGPVWQHRYFERAIRHDRELERDIRYCVENPVRAGIVEDYREYPHWWCGFTLD
jgi:REP element-mobilizing transposase RayT